MPLILQFSSLSLTKDLYKLFQNYIHTHAPVLDEVLLESASDLLVGERGDGDHSPELASEPLVQPVELLVAPAHLDTSVKSFAVYCPAWDLG